MRTICVLALTATLSTSALAQAAQPPAQNAPLAPGKPAGVKSAQDDDNRALVIELVGLGALTAGIALLIRNNVSNSTSTN